MEEERLHVAAFPTNGSGHINPMLELCRRLVPLGFRVSIIFPSNLCSQVESRLQSDDLHISLVPSPPSDKLLYTDSELQEQVKPVLEALHPPVKCLICDIFLGWSQDLADILGIPRAVFIPSNSSIEALFNHIPELTSKGYIPATDTPDNDALIDFIPGLKPFPKDMLPLGFKTGSPVVRNLNTSVKRTKDAACVLVNTVEELDQELVIARRSQFSSYLAVGPLVPLWLLQEQDTTVSFPNDPCVSWLDRKPHASVLYIAFGSVGTLKANQVEKIAEAVKASRQPVLWAVRRNFAKDAPENFYEGLQERAGEEALVVEWAPQAGVLRHPAVGAFWTHCGWNSTLEALCSGVPMICWPCFGDQNVNAETIVNRWKIGVMAADGPEDDVSCKDLENVVLAVMNGEGQAMRSRAQELKKIVREGTCREKNLRQLKTVILGSRS